MTTQEVTSQAEADYFIAIRDGLRAHPEWLRTAMDGITQGMYGALADERTRANKLDLALRSALALALPDRVSAETKKLLNETICHVLPKEGASAVERKFLERG